jgi:hypothetical protein
MWETVWAFCKVAFDVLGWAVVAFIASMIIVALVFSAFGMEVKIVPKTKRPIDS